MFTRGRKFFGMEVRSGAYVNKIEDLTLPLPWVWLAVMRDHRMPFEPVRHISWTKEKTPIANMRHIR
jgi:hypothetical protein